MIEAPIKQVFDYMSTPENDFQWQYGTLATATITSRHNGMGVYFRSIGHLMGRRNLGTYEVIESNSNMRYRFKSISGPLYLQTTYTFETAGDGTKVEISIQIGVVNFPRMNERILGRRMQKQLRENLAVLRDILEAKHISSSPEAIPLIS
jgi:hypothetical protein